MTRGSSAPYSAIDLQLQCEPESQHEGSRFCPDWWIISNSALTFEPSVKRPVPA